MKLLPPPSLQPLLSSPCTPWVPEGLTCERRDLANRAPNTNPAALENKTPGLKMLLKIKHIPGVHLSTAESLNTPTLKGCSNATAQDHTQPEWSDPWEFGHESGALFEP